MKNSNSQRTNAGDERCASPAALFGYLKNYWLLPALLLFTFSVTHAQNYPKIPQPVLLEELQPPSGKLSVVIDTDTYNEIDDQFAVVYALLSPEHMDVKAIYAAPFLNSRSSGPGEGMSKSYDEILNLLAKMGRKSEGFAFRGSQEFLQDYDEPVINCLFSRNPKQKRRYGLEALILLPPIL